MKNPEAYIRSLETDVKKWTVHQARKHFLDSDRYTATKWVPTKWQIFEVVEHDVMFNCNAFHVVQPRPHLSANRSRAAMSEPWRRADPTDPWDIDLRLFECLHCKQYSKTQWCSHCVAVIVNAV